MGIKDLNTYLKKEGIDCFFSTPLINFSEQRVAFDGLNWIFTYLSSAYRRVYDKNNDPLEIICQQKLYEEIVRELLIFNNKFMNYKITPVWIWDGISKDNKTATKLDRKNSRKAIMEQRDQLRNELLKQQVLERDPQLIEKYKRMVLNTAFITRDNIEKIKNLTKELGLPTIVADDEAENLASSLAVQRKISAVWSSDTDTYPLGAPIVIKGFENIQGVLHIRGIYTLKMLKELNMDHDEFRDWCILLGTDFNNRLDQIGPAKSRILIEKYSCLENVEINTKHNLSFLNYKEVRKQLTPYETNFNCKDFQVNKNIEEQEIKKFLNCREMILFFNNIIDLPSSKPVPKN